MPTYEYRCSNCHELTEAFQRMSDAPLTKCPNCGKDALERIVSGGAGVLYKGEGWYVTDYSKKSSGGRETAESSEKSKVSSAKHGDTGTGKSAKEDGPKPESTKEAAPKVEATKPAGPAKRSESD